MVLLKNVAIAAAAFMPAVSAAACDLDARVSNQGELDAYIANCTVVTGAGISINSNYTGVFNTSALTNVSNIVSTELPGYAPGLTDIFMDELVTITNTMALPESSVQFLSVPKLATADFIRITGGTQSGRSSLTIDFPSLTSSGLGMTGAIAGAHFPRLANSSMISAAPSTVNGVPGYNLSFPALKNVADVVATGDIVGFSAPVLESASNVRFTNSSQALDLQFPALINTARDMRFMLYNVKNVSLPLLQNTGAMTIEATNNLQLNLTSLESAHDIIVTGSIANVQLPVLKTFDATMSIRSSVVVNCTSAKTAFKASTADFAQYVGPRTFECYRIRKDYSLRDGLGVGLGVGLGLIFVCVLAFALRYMGESKQAKALGVTRKEMRAAKKGGIKEKVKPVVGSTYSSKAETPVAPPPAYA